MFLNQNQTLTSNRRKRRREKRTGNDLLYDRTNDIFKHNTRTAEKIWEFFWFTSLNEKCRGSEVYHMKCVKLWSVKYSVEPLVDLFDVRSRSSLTDYIHTMEECFCLFIGLIFFRFKTVWLLSERILYFFFFDFSAFRALARVFAIKKTYF